MFELPVAVLPTKYSTITPVPIGRYEHILIEVATDYPSHPHVMQVFCSQHRFRQPKILRLCCIQSLNGWMFQALHFGPVLSFSQ